MERNPRTLGTERMPFRPLPYGFIPPNGIPYPIRYEKSWRSVATKWHFDARELIYYNFNTNDPAEVNWYLSHRVGCNTPTPDGLNWMFSPSANPGIIYISLGLAGHEFRVRGEIEISSFSWGVEHQQTIGS